MGGVRLLSGFGMRCRSVCKFKLIMMVSFFFLMQLGVRCVRDGVNTVFKFLRCKGKFIFLE